MRDCIAMLIGVSYSLLYLRKERKDMNWFNRKCLFTAIFLSLIVNLHSLSANPDSKEVPKVTDEIENFFKKDVDSFINTRLEDIISSCMIAHNGPLAESCIFRRLPHSLFVLRNCRKNNLLNRDFTTAKELKAELITCLNTLRKDIYEGALPRETPIQNVSAVSSEEQQALKATEKFFKEDLDSFMEHDLGQIIDACGTVDARPLAIQSCVFRRLSYKGFSSLYCRENNLFKRNFSTAKDFKAELITCLNMLRKEFYSTTHITAQAREDILSN